MLFKKSKIAFFSQTLQGTTKMFWKKIPCLNEVYKFSFDHFQIRRIVTVLRGKFTLELSKNRFFLHFSKVYVSKNIVSKFHKKV